MEEDLATSPDLRTMREVVRMGNTIDPMIQLTGDCPSCNDSGKMPVLDLQIWTQGDLVLYEHYRKPMANKLLMLEMSALPAAMKRTAMTQEVVRIMRNTRPGLPEEVAAVHLNDFSARMRASGYDQRYRFQVIKSGLSGYDKMLEEERRGGRPVNRPRSWDEDERLKKKELQKKRWFRKGGFYVPLFVPHTPGGELEKRIRLKEAQNNQGRKIRFKIVAKSGVTLEQKLRRSNPWAGGGCGQDGCFPCRGGGEGGGDCRRESVTYTLWCERCRVEVHRVVEYKGETGRNACSRGSEHLANLQARSVERSVLWRHSVEVHAGQVDVPYQMRITGYYPDALDRQIAERVQITNFRGDDLLNRRNEMGGVRVERQGYRRWGGD